MSGYRPAAFSFADAETRIAEGRAQIAAAEDDMTIDAGALEDGGTPAVCALLAWRRCAAERERRLRFADIPSRLRKLIQVYQLEKILLESELFPAGGANS
ncbi:MAG: STAS domain-containing protein [Gammaproteobacteria bacterium]